MPGGPLDALDRLVRPGQTLTTKLNGPESVLAGTSGAHWAALCGLALVLLAVVAAVTVVGQRRVGSRGRRRGVRRSLVGAPRARRARDRVA